MALRRPSSYGVAAMQNHQPDFRSDISHWKQRKINWQEFTNSFFKDCKFPMSSNCQKEKEKGELHLESHIKPKPVITWLHSDDESKGLLIIVLVSINGQHECTVPAKASTKICCVSKRNLKKKKRQWGWVWKESGVKCRWSMEKCSKPTDLSAVLGR